MTSLAARISLIIPLRLTDGTYEAEERLNRIIDTVPADCYEIIISDYGTGPVHQPVLDRMAARGVRIIRHPAPEPLFSIGRARDHGVQMALCPVIMFNDIDFIADRQTYLDIHREVLARDLAANRFDFFCVPVMFLTEAGSAAWLGRKDTGAPFLPDWRVDTAEAATGLVQSVAFGSSAMVVNRAHYLATGGHDPAFKGHGAEDYELLHRLTSLAPLMPRSHDYLTDFRSNSVRHYWGFRAYFALWGLPLYARGLAMVHLWHPRRPEKGYFRARQNFRVLKKAMLAFDRSGRQPAALPHLASSDHLVIETADGPAALAALRMILPHFAGWSVVPPGSPMSPPGDKLTMVRIRLAGSPADSIADKTGDGFEPVRSAGRIDIRTRLGRTVDGYWQEIAIGDRQAAAGTIPPPRSPDDPLMDSFGGAAALDRSRHAKPKKAKKSPWHVRLRRFLTRM